MKTTNNTNITLTILNSILAGILIGLCGLTNIIIENKYIGAFLFSFGLLTILKREYNLYTGKIHLLLNDKLSSNRISWINLLEILAGNFIGSYIIVGGLARFCTNINSDLIWTTKLNHGYAEIIFLSIICGALMYLAVSGWKNDKNDKNDKNPLSVIMPIMIFILIGADHSIANMFYMSVATNINWNMMGYVLINIVGNAIGSLAFYKMDLMRTNFQDRFD